MGLQDRDYYREKYKGAHLSPRSTVRKSGKNSTGIKYLLYPLVDSTPKCNLSAHAASCSCSAKNTA